eukprot:4352533-Pyramimonas_sp.AAC.1
MELHSSYLLADAAKFSDSLRQDGVITAALELGLSAIILLMLMLQHSATRALRCRAANSLPMYADKSIFAGPRHSKNAAKKVVHAVLTRRT